MQIFSESERSKQGSILCLLISLRLVLGPLLFYFDVDMKCCGTYTTKSMKTYCNPAENPFIATLRKTHCNPAAVTQILERIKS